MMRVWGVAVTVTVAVAVGVALLGKRGGAPHKRRRRTRATGRHKTTRGMKAICNNNEEKEEETLFRA